MCALPERVLTNDVTADDICFGEEQENARLKPLLTALIDVAEAAYELSSKGVSVTRLNMQTEGLARLEKLCGEEK